MAEQKRPATIDDLKALSNARITGTHQNSRGPWIMHEHCGCSIDYDPVGYHFMCDQSPQHPPQYWSTVLPGKFPVENFYVIETVVPVVEKEKVYRLVFDEKLGRRHLVEI